MNKLHDFIESLIKPFLFYIPIESGFVFSKPWSLPFIQENINKKEQVLRLCNMSVQNISYKNAIAERNDSRGN